MKVSISTRNREGRGGQVNHEHKAKSRQVPPKLIRGIIFLHLLYISHTLSSKLNIGFVGSIRTHM